MKQPVKITKPKDLDLNNNGLALFLKGLKKRVKQIELFLEYT